MKMPLPIAAGISALLAAAVFYLSPAPHREPAEATIALGPTALVPASGSRSLETPVRAREYQLTEGMEQLASGLGGLFTPAELAFQSSDLDDQIQEALGQYQQDWVFSLAKLERALLQLHPGNASEALAVLLRMLPPGDRAHGRAYRVFFRAWARVDAANALTGAIAVLPDNEVRLAAGEEVLANWAARDAAAAANAAAELPETYGKDYLLYTVPYTYAKADPDAAVAWADGLPEAYSRTAIQHCMLQWLEQDEPRAAEYAVNQAKSGAIDSRNDVIISEVADALAGRSIHEALTWLEQIPKEGGAYYKGLETVVEHWAEKDPKTAAAWLETVETTPQMDPVIDRYARTLALMDPHEALRWTKSIQTPGARIVSVRAVLGIWSETAPANARKWAVDNGYGLFPSG